MGPATGAGARELEVPVAISATPAFAAFADARDDAVLVEFTVDDGLAGARAAAVLLLPDIVVKESLSRKNGTFRLLNF